MLNHFYEGSDAVDNILSQEMSNSHHRLQSLHDFEQGLGEFEKYSFYYGRVQHLSNYLGSPRKPWTLSCRESAFVPGLHHRITEYVCIMNITVSQNHLHGLRGVTRQAVRVLSNISSGAT